MKTHTLISLAAALAFPGMALAADSGTNTSDAKKAPCRAPSAEMAAWEKSALELYDTNSNGVLDSDERAVLRADIEAGKFTPPPMPPCGNRGPGKQQPPPEVLARYDKDGDGVLSAAEEAALRADIESGAFTLPEPPDGAQPGKGRRPPPPPAETSD